MLLQKVPKSQQNLLSRRVLKFERRVIIQQSPFWLAAVSADKALDSEIFSNSRICPQSFVSQPIILISQLGTLSADVPRAIRDKFTQQTSISCDSTWRIFYCNMFLVQKVRQFRQFCQHSVIFQFSDYFQLAQTF